VLARLIAPAQKRRKNEDVWRSARRLAKCDWKLKIWLHRDCVQVNSVVVQTKTMRQFLHHPLIGMWASGKLAEFKTLVFFIVE
jgi:hypothetical protein